MTIEEQLKSLILSRYKSIREFSLILDMPYSTIDTILKRGIQKASVTNIIKICKHLKISTDELANEKIVDADFNKINVASLSAEDEILIKKYRALDERGKITVDKCLNEQYGFIEQDQSIKEETATVITHPAFGREKVTQTVNVMDGEMDDEIKAELREYAEELMAAKYGKTSVLSENIEKGKDLS